MTKIQILLTNDMKPSANCDKELSIFLFLSGVKDYNRDLLKRVGNSF